MDETPNKGGDGMDRQEYARRADALKQRLWRTALCYLNDEQAALEAVDSAVYKGLLAVHNLRQPEYFDTWLTRILINECKAEQRRRARLHPLELLAHHAAAQQELDNLPLRQAVAALDPKLRAVVVLRFFAGYTLEETARCLGLPWPPGSGGRWNCFGWSWTSRAERRAEEWSDTTGSGNMSSGCSSWKRRPPRWNIRYSGHSTGQRGGPFGLLAAGWPGR